MNNRFVRRIKSGEIPSPEALKAEFKALAKLLHPDLAGAGSHEDFVALRGEYEAALSGFERHRFGLGSGARTGRPAGPFDRAAFYGELETLFKKGFPKVPRHEKERSRYEYRRYLVLRRLGAWDEAHPARFEAFEAALLALKESSPRGYDEVLDLVLSLFEYHELGRRGRAAANLAHVRAGLEQAFAAAAARPELGELVPFLELLRRDLTGGPAFG